METMHHAVLDCQFIKQACYFIDDCFHVKEDILLPSIHAYTTRCPCLLSCSRKLANLLCPPEKKHPKMQPP